VGDVLARFKDGRLTGFGTADGVLKAAVNSIVSDREGSIWIATSRGLYRARKRLMTAYSHLLVEPPFWRTWWFIALTSLGGATLIYLAFRQRVARLAKAHAAQETFSRRLLDSQERERQRIAAELHDSLGQSLLIIKNRAFLASSSPDDKEQTKEQLDEITSATTQAIEEVREIAYNLRPYQLDRFGLTRTLEAIFTNASDSSGIHFSASVQEIDGLFSNEAEIGIYRIVQESVSNIIKHSRATEARLAIERNGHELQIRIQDNGQGFTSAQVNAVDPRRGGLGLIGIAERARMLGGKHAIDSTPGRGTVITIKFPVRRT
jgi:signal transduction histidine kinase